MANDEDDDFDMLHDDEHQELGEEEEEGDAMPRLSAASQALAVRRAIEQRMEQRQMDQMLNYLELDFVDEE